MGFWQRKSSWFAVVQLCMQRHGPGMPRLLCQLGALQGEPLPAWALQRWLSCSEGGIALLSRAPLAWGARGLLWGHGHSPWGWCLVLGVMDTQGEVLLVLKATPGLTQ